MFADDDPDPRAAEQSAVTAFPYAANFDAQGSALIQNMKILVVENTAE